MDKEKYEQARSLRFDIMEATAPMFRAADQNESIDKFIKDIVHYQYMSRLEQFGVTIDGGYERNCRLIGAKKKADERELWLLLEPDEVEQMLNFVKELMVKREERVKREVAELEKKFEEL